MVIDSTTRSLLGITTGLQATALMGENLKLMPKFTKRGRIIKPVKTKKLMKPLSMNF